MAKKSIFLEIIPKDNFDFSKLVVDHANGRPVDLSGCDLYHIQDPIFALKDVFIDFIIQHGFTDYTQMQLILEDLTTPSTPPTQIESILIRYLSNIGIDDELIIVDPYFFPRNMDSSYPELIVKILSQFACKLSCLRIVTASHHGAFSERTKATIEEEIKKRYSSINIAHTKSNYLHDRFWISNKRGKGILTGTSLNGFGKKYSIVDYLSDQDVKDIVANFASQQLI